MVRGTREDRMQSRPVRKIGIRITDGEFLRKFESLTDRAASGCWEWLGGRVSGYGTIYRDGKLWKAHRMAWKIHHGSDPGDKCVCHSCDNPGCVNPDHLWLGEHEDNMGDMKRKGRAKGFRGEANKSAKITAEDVLAIRELYSAGESQPKIGSKYGLDQTTVSDIVLRKTWAHVQDRV